MKIAPAITAPMPAAATRVSRPTSRPREPKNSASTTSSAKIQGMPMVPVKKSMVPAKPLPPNQPSSFWAPCGKMTTASTSLKTGAAVSSVVRSTLSSIIQSSISSASRRPLHGAATRAPRSRPT